jgi:DNA-binding NarL/FixJ family response regulator
MADALKVAVIEDDPRYRHGLETLLAHSAGFSLAGSFGSAESALRALEQAPHDGRAWDLALMDLQLPGIGGLEATRRLKALLPQVSVVVFTVFEEPATMLQAICAGADGYLLKKAPAREILAQLHAVAAGGSPLTADVGRKVLGLLRALGPGTAHDPGAAPDRLDLTTREQDVLRCLVRGLSYKQVADELGMSLDTVRTHIRAVYRKLQVHSVAEAVARAIRERLV